MALDSDVSNADSLLTVSIYLCNRIGPDLGKMFIRITSPGNQLSVIDRPIRDDDKARFPHAWKAFENKVGTAHGTPLEAWAKDRPEDITEGQVDALKALKFLYVEQVALASDGQLQGVGMGGVALRTKAGAYMQNRTASRSSAEMTALQTKNDELAAQMRAMQEQLATLAAAPKNKGGRPPKAKAAEQVAA